jgi:hypothetical protein
VLASVAFDAGVISPKIAGAWLDYVLRKGWPLRMPIASGESAEVSSESPSIA